MQTYEVEIKSLLGSSERADDVRHAMKQLDPSCTLTSKNKQLNHYFEGGTLKKLAKVIAPHIPAKTQVQLDDLSRRAKNFSVRTREKNGEVLMVVKASVGDDTSENGVSRMEFEKKVGLTLDELDQIVLSAKFKYQAKWSREREEYVCNGINVTLDKNAGYGWLAEFERVIHDESKVASAREEIRALMAKLGVVELPQERLERMFSFYNDHWPEYYGTDKIFVVE
jgi:predicted adenylyl cyclase CyaB